MNFRRAFSIFAIASILTLTSCNKTKTVDGSSDEAMKTSIEKMREGLPAEEKEQLGKDMMAISLEGVNLFEAGQNPDLMKMQMRDRLDGKSKEEINKAADEVRRKYELEAEKRRLKVEEEAEARRLQEEEEEEKKKAEAEREERRVKMLAQVEGEIKELVEAEEKAAADTEALKKFVVKRSRFYHSETRFSSDPTIELTVKNGTGAAISRVSFNGTLSSPGRAIPWVKENFSYKIPGGLEPGEEVTWQLQPNRFGEWKNAPEKSTDTVLTIATLSVEGANEEVLLDSEFPEHKAKRLVQLRESLKELQSP